MTVEVARYVELDCGHRVPDHESKCRNPHGHRYRVEVTASGTVIDERGNPQDGMVIDFSHLSTALNEVVHDPCDHGFLVADYDRPMREALRYLDRAQGTLSKVIVVTFPPTAERLAEWWGEGLQRWLTPRGVALGKVTVWETAKSAATWYPGLT